MFLGRKKIYTDTETIDRNNVVAILTDAMLTHTYNQTQEDYLWEYYKGKTPIYAKTKHYRDEINNIVSENRAMQITEFYEGYIFGEPVQYVCRAEDEKHDEIAWLNDKMVEKNKTALDEELSEYLLVMGVCPRLILPSDETFELYTLDPRYAFNVYYSGLGEKCVMSVKFITKKNGNAVYSVYTDRYYFEIEGDAIIKQETHLIGKCPMIEYTLNNVRMGIFEPVLTILDAIDTLQSSRMDDIQQFIESILAILGAEIDEDTLLRIKEWGALALPEGADAKYLTSNLSQNDIQKLKDDLMSAVIEITGMPNRNGNGSTSDTGSAVILRDGWQTADAKSKRIEIQFKKAEREMLSIVFDLSYAMDNVQLSNKDIDIRFTRRNYENIQTKAQVLVQMLDNDKIAPELAFEYSGMFCDPLLAYRMSQPYIEKTEVEDERDKMSEVQ